MGDITVIVVALLTEEWRPIPSSYCRHEASSYGRIRNQRGLILAQHVFRGRYLRVHNVRRHGRVELVHQLIAEAFLGPRRGRVTRHLDDNGFNNNVRNLGYGTQKQNCADAAKNNPLRHLALRRGGRNKLSIMDVVAIRKQLAAGAKRSAVAEAWGMSARAIASIASGRSWKTPTNDRRKHV